MPRLWLGAGTVGIGVLLALAYSAGRSNPVNVASPVQTPASASAPSETVKNNPKPVAPTPQSEPAIVVESNAASNEMVSPESTAPSATSPIVEESAEDSAPPSSDSPSHQAEAEIDAAQTALGDGWTRTKDEVDTDGRIVRWSRDGGHAFLVLEVHRESDWSFAALKRKEEARLDGDPARAYALIRYRTGGEARPATGIWNYSLRNRSEPLMRKMLAGFPAAGDEPPLLFHCSREEDAPREATLAAFDAAFNAVGRTRRAR